MLYLLAYLPSLMPKLIAKNTTTYPYKETIDSRHFRYYPYLPSPSLLECSTHNLITQNVPTYSLTKTFSDCRWFWHCLPTKKLKNTWILPSDDIPLCLIKRLFIDSECFKHCLNSLWTFSANAPHASHPPITNSDKAPNELEFNLEFTDLSRPWQNFLHVVLKITLWCTYTSSIGSIAIRSMELSRVGYLQ